MRDDTLPLRSCCGVGDEDVQVIGSAQPAWPVDPPQVHGGRMTEGDGSRQRGKELSAPADDVIPLGRRVHRAHATRRLPEARAVEDPIADPGASCLLDREGPARRSHPRILAIPNLADPPPSRHLWTALGRVRRSWRCSGVLG
ncbi:hypothetical protein, partial [Cellulomonas sp. RIT-PI-Y]|uniref:hypothetical protein n=1 Tax=Cellulomonas sp. RIT-PI-Y TaxID=3035297 RepID=UPI0021DB1A3C